MSVAVFTSFNQQSDSSGNPLSGGSVTVYAAGTTTLIDNFTASDLSGAPASNPIVLDSAGRHALRYIALQAYKVLLKSSAGVTIATFDNIDPGISIGIGDLAIVDGGTGASTAPAALTNLGGATAAELAALAAEVASLSGTLASSEKTHIATGTTGQRPASPINGDIRRNTTTSRIEHYNGTTWENVVTTTELKADVQALTGPFTKQYLTSGTAATYTRPADCTAICVKMVGGGGGGGAATTNNGAAGGTTIFNSINANGGSASTVGNNTPAAGGTGGTGSASLRITGSAGEGRHFDGTGTVIGGNGGVGMFGGQGMASKMSGGGAIAGGNAPANTGGGGAGGNNGVADGNSSGGGGAGEYVELVITSPSATYTYTVGAGGAGGAAGGAKGGDGGSGLIIVEEFYN